MSIAPSLRNLNIDLPACPSTLVKLSLLMADDDCSVDQLAALIEKAAAAADFAVSITGIAGPAGGTPEQPVGLVFIGVAAPHGTATFKHHFSGSRADIRQAATEAALRHLLEAVAS